MHAHVPRGAATAMEGPCFESSLASESWTGTLPGIKRWKGDPVRLCPHQGAGKGQKNQFQPERPEQAIDTSVPGRVNRVLLPRFTCK